jgi:hypothetical protein
VRFLIILCLILSFSFAKADNLEKKSLIYLFKHNYYTYICMNRWEYINKYVKKREDLLSLVAYACLKKNYLTPALDLSKVLRMTKSGRINAMYINTLFLIKLLIIRYIEDGYNISKIKIPYVEGNDLAKVFYLIQKQKPKVKNNSFEVKSGNITYNVVFDPDINNIIINIYKNGKFIKREKFW